MSDGRWMGRWGETSDLSLAVGLEDPMTGADPVGSPQVTVDGEDPDARSPSGYSLFFDRPAAPVTVELDGGTPYLDDERVIDLATHDPVDPVTIELEPAPAYPFPGWVTLVRGQVTVDGDPVGGAAISVAGLGRTTRTAPTGEYVYYFVEGVDCQVVTRQGKTVIEVDGADPEITAAYDQVSDSTSKTVEPRTMVEVDIDLP